MVDLGQIEMRVRTGIPLPRKMFGRSNLAAILHSLHICNTLLCYLDLILPKGAIVDYRIMGIVVYIGNGGKIKVEAHPFNLMGYFLAHFVDQPIILYGT